jgi:phosphoglycolate phosphatase-like HAD superfamily hydrolase
MCAEVLENAADIRVQLCPSIRELLERLHASGKLLGVASGNLETIGWTKLKAAEIRDFFSFGCFSDTAELREDIFRMGVAKARRQLGNNASVCVVGDTPSDIQAARKAGIPVISVATGFYPYDELSRLEPDRCLTCCTELLQQR